MSGRKMWLGMVLAVAGGAGGAACAAEAEADANTYGRMTRRDWCAETQCDLERRVCREGVDRRCDDCYDACADLMLHGGWDASCLDSCDRACDPSVCYHGSCQGSTCVQRGIEFTPAPGTDAALYEACDRAVRHLRACDPTRSYVDCEVVARTVRPAVAELYDCLAEVPCGGDRTPCDEAFPPGALGDQVCLWFDAICGGTTECNPLWAYRLNWWGSYFLPGVVEALWSCATETSCEDLVLCLDAWTAAVP